MKFEVRESTWLLKSKTAGITYLFIGHIGALVPGLGRNFSPGS